MFLSIKLPNELLKEINSIEIKVEELLNPSLW